MPRLKRTHTCGELRSEHVGREVTLAGWVHARRDHGGLLFIDLRDRYGITQVVFNPEHSADLFAEAERLRSEFVVAVRGEVVRRPAGTENPRLATGEVELRAAELEVLSRAETPPIEVGDDVAVAGEVRLTYRYLDLRRPSMQALLLARSRLCQAIRDFYHARGFVEVETPFLTKSTPEGARDFLVPSRLEPGKFYALPQSPQLFKQLLMVAGFDKYFQIVKCFRDEDFRANRQPEFTQLDVEMSFVDEADIIESTEALMAETTRVVLGREVTLPFPRLSYREALERYGTDKPDLRLGMEMVDVSDLAGRSEFRVFRAALEAGGEVRALAVPGGARFSRQEVDALVARAQELGAKGLAWYRVGAEGLVGPIAKFLAPELQQELTRRLQAKPARDGGPGDLILAVADEPGLARTVLGQLRLEVAARLETLPAPPSEGGPIRFCWITDVPLFEWDEKAQRWDPTHHPFTSPREEDIPYLEQDPGRVMSRAYDLVLNGEELGSGSVRIHDPDLQQRIFKVLRFTPEEVEARFGFFLRALRYGTPPHGGIALGIERWLMCLFGRESIRDVMAFPKTQSGVCLLTGAPAPVEEEQLRELGLRVRPE